jgi:hypothetical protein
MTTPLVSLQTGTLTYAPERRRRPIRLGSAAWRRWLAAPEAGAFRIETADGMFTARREQRRGRWY